MPPVEGGGGPGRVAGKQIPKAKGKLLQVCWLSLFHQLGMKAGQGLLGIGT